MDDDALAPPRAAAEAPLLHDVTLPSRQALATGTDAELLLQLQATLLSHARFRTAATALATELARVWKLERVAIGWTEAQDIEIVAVSSELDIEARAELLQRLAAAMDEAIAQGTTMIHPGSSAARPLQVLAHEALQRLTGHALCTIPLVDDARVVGALTLERVPGSAAVFDRARLENLACLLAPILHLKHAAALTATQRLRQGWRELRSALRAPGRARAKLAGIALAGLAVVALGGWPVAYRVSAPARVEGSIQRALVAPADGYLRQVSVKPGDRVQADQVLAELADQDLELERRKWASQFAQHVNRADAALAGGDRTQYVVSHSQAAEAAAERELVDARLARGKVRAPFDGIVIKGDLSQLLGAPVQRGDVLLTVAPAQSFRLIVEVDERDIRDISDNAAGVVALAALPGSHVNFEVVRITPVATSEEARNFYEIEARLQDPPITLRPGMQGIAKINAPDRTLAWIWSHRFLEWLRIALWSLGG